MWRKIALPVVLAWLIGLGMGVAASSRYERIWLSPELCDDRKARRIADGFEIVPHQRDPCYLQRSRLRWP